MERATIAVNGTLLPLYRCHTLIIGSGAAALNCAVHLNGFGVEDILIVTEQLGGGTSNNSGSDKQTYYKLSVLEKNRIRSMIWLALCFLEVPCTAIWPWWSGLSTGVLPFGPDRGALSP